MEIVISKSTKKSNTYEAVSNGSKTVSFGEKGASYYTKHKDPDRKALYIARHKLMRIGLNQVLKQQGG